ncbi:MAG: carbamoyltransferase, partial [Gemmatimonas sp. SG8_17]
MVTRRLHVVAGGSVQGVGFRPFVYRAAVRLHLTGWVRNTASGVAMELEGAEVALAEFLATLHRDKPPRAVIHTVQHAYLDPLGHAGFHILQSDDEGSKSTQVLPDIATCAECLAEIRCASDRRYRYPFTTCTDCGPRFSIIQSLPYDRVATTMATFSMCAACKAEYQDPQSRRFHAQPNACPDCGPRLELWDPSAQALAAGDAALRYAAEAIRSGATVALKGIGGFQLVVDARNGRSVERLRARKRREAKPLAVMYPCLESVQDECVVSEEEVHLLTSPQAPIVLLTRRGTVSVCGSVAGPAPTLGVMLPYTPLHHILLDDLCFPVVATSGNVTDDPICTDQDEAVERLGGIADFLLVHDRPIARHVDDSVVRVFLRREVVLRRARGYAPSPVAAMTTGSRGTSILGVGAHQKNAVAMTSDNGIVISQHIGDLESAAAHRSFRSVVADLSRLHDYGASIVVHDLHPDYSSTRYAKSCRIPRVAVKNHHAQVAACMADTEI